MSPAQSDYPELSFLQQAQIVLAPLVETLISKDSKPRQESDLFAQNLRIFLLHGIASIPVHLPLKERLKRDEKSLFHSRLLDVLEILESLVPEQSLLTTLVPDTTNSLDEQVNSPVGNATTSDEDTVSNLKGLSLNRKVFSQSRYPKLKALLARASQRSGGDHSELQAGICLPHTPSKAKEALDIVEKFNEGNIGLATAFNRTDQEFQNHMSYDASSSKKTAERAPHMSDVRRYQGYFPVLWKVLTDNIAQTGCTSTHIAKLQIRHHGGNAGGFNSFTQKAFISCCPGAYGDKWQSTTYKTASQQLDPHLTPVQNICQVIVGSYNDSKTLDIIVHDNKIFRNREMAHDLRLPHVLPSLSLDSLLQYDSESLNLYHKILLALNLSHTLLRMQQEGMTSEWASETIFFLFNEQDNTLDDAYNPYIPYTLASMESSKTERFTNETGVPLLVAFGKLLLEIALGRLVNETDTRLHHRPDIVLKAILLQNQLESKVPAGYHDAIEMCIGSNQRNDDYDMKDPEVNGEHDPEKRFKAILLKVITHLEEALETFKRPAYIQECAWDDYNFPIKVELSKDLPITGWKSRAYNARTQPCNQLFDEGGGQKKGRDQKADATDSFMSLATKFYEDHIKNLSSNERISIAILDTGVDQSNPFIRAKCKMLKHLIGQSPIKETKSFVGGPPGDELGHGTNVAALILKLAPHADLYIAKISRLREEAGTSHIAEAINWAHKSGVNIISMSFGMREHDKEIEAAIKKAENDGVIILAAASNDGANTDRAFPARMDKVICIHASDGKGNHSDFNPTARSDCQNFCTLGESIESICEKDIYISGTSYATPVAAAFAANALKYVRNCSKLSDDYRKRAFNREGMNKLFIAMSHKRGSYSYIAPWRKMWRMDEDDTIEDITFRIKEALKMSR